MPVLPHQRARGYGSSSGKDERIATADSNVDLLTGRDWDGKAPKPQIRETEADDDTPTDI